MYIKIYLASKIFLGFVENTMEPFENSVDGFIGFHLLTMIQRIHCHCIHMLK